MPSVQWKDKTPLTGIFVFIAKWMMANGLVMLLPHGYDGAASEHSSCRMERFLQQTDSRETSPDGDDVNLQVINPTTPAQYFHALRRQIVRDVRKPLVVVGPKVLLRLSDATSPYTEFLPGTHFQPVIGDAVVEPINVKKVILCSGKHYYNLNAHRVQNRLTDVAIVRVESLCPFPVQEINSELAKYKNAQGIIAILLNPICSMFVQIVNFRYFSNRFCLESRGAPKHGGVVFCSATLR